MFKASILFCVILFTAKATVNTDDYEPLNFRQAVPVDLDSNELEWLMRITAPEQKQTAIAFIPYLKGVPRILKFWYNAVPARQWMFPGKSLQDQRRFDTSRVANKYFILCTIGFSHEQFLTVINHGKPQSDFQETSLETQMFMKFLVWIGASYKITNCSKLADIHLDTEEPWSDIQISINKSRPNLWSMCAVKIARFLDQRGQYKHDIKQFLKEAFNTK